MISRQEAERIAAEWARRETLRRGYEHTPMLEEFDVGYVVWSRRPASAPPGVPGDGATTIIDKETGEVSSWPGLPPPVVMNMYRQGREERRQVPRAVEPAERLRRETVQGPAPTSAAHLTVGGQLHIGLGAKGDVEVRHHPLVQSYLDDLPTGHLVRGGDRHAELVVLSDVLHAADADRSATGEPPLTLPDAQLMFGAAMFEVFRVTAPGDPHGGGRQRPCESCLDVLLHFGLLPPEQAAYRIPKVPEPHPVPVAGRFPDEVAYALVEAGWRPDEHDDLMAGVSIRMASSVPGRRYRLESFPAAEMTFTAFPMLRSHRRGPGEQVWIRRFDIGGRMVKHTADILGDFGERIGSRLFPIGCELGGPEVGEAADAILAVDEQGRVFALDQGGEWFLGDGIDAALTTLLLGRASARVREDGTW